MDELNMMNIFDILPCSTNRDPYGLRQGGLLPYMQSFSSMDVQHPYIRNWIYNSPKNATYRNLGTSMKLADVGAEHDACLGTNLFMGSINSRTGFTSKENDFSAMCPIVIFKGKQRFTCHYLNYPVLSLPNVTTRSDPQSLPADSFKVEFSVDMIGGKLVLDPETNLIAEPEPRFQEYMRRKEQLEKSINQTMQAQITQACAKCPSMTLCRIRKEANNLKNLLNQPENLCDYVYGEIQKQVNDFCSWSLDPVTVDGGLQDAFDSLLNEGLSSTKPEFIVTTPEIADMIATGHHHRTRPIDVVYTVLFGDDKGEFVPGQIQPYNGVSEKVSLDTKSISVCGTQMPILQVPHLKKESSVSSNAFEHQESFWTFNEVGYLPKFSAKIEDYKNVDRTKIRVTDLRLGRDGMFTMDDCLKKGGGLLPETYNRWKYQEMMAVEYNLGNMIKNSTSEEGLIDLIGKELPQNSPYNLYFPSSKVRYQNRGGNDRCNFRSTGIFGNRASFDNWHPPSGDVESAKDWLAKRLRIGADGLNVVWEYAKQCANIMWTQDDVKYMMNINHRFPTATDMYENYEDANINAILKDMIKNKGFTKFACIPRYVEALANISNKLLQSKRLLCTIAEINEDDVLMIRTVCSDLEKIVNFRAQLMNFSKKVLSIANRTNLEHGQLTSCPASTPTFNRPTVTSDWQNVENATEKEIRFAYRLYLLCIAPLIYTHVYSVHETDNIGMNSFVDYQFENPDDKESMSRKTEVFQQPFFKDSLMTNIPLLFNSVEHNARGGDEDPTNFFVTDVSAYDPLYRFDLDIIKEENYSRSNNFFDHFVSHRFQYLRQIGDEPFVVKVMAAVLNMTSYTPKVESIIGHTCLMNRKYRIVRQCSLMVGSVGMYRGGKDNMMYAVGGLSTVTKMTANNEIQISQRLQGNCFIIDPLSAGRVISNAVSKGLVSGMTSTLVDVPLHVKEGGGSRLKNKWWANLGYVVEALPGRHPEIDQHFFLPLNGRHMKENYNEHGTDPTKLDMVGPHGGWFAENMYSLKGYSEAHLIFGKLLNKKSLPLYNTSKMHGLYNMHQNATVERRELAQKVVDKVEVVHTVFSRISNLGFLERQLYDVPSPNCTFASDHWRSYSPLKANSCSDPRFVDTLNLTHRRQDKGIKMLDEQDKGFDDRTAPYRTGVKGIYTTENTR